MSKINILDPSIYNLIAAGEVVERPMSVVKELVENSIDAGATDITIEIKDGGTTFIQVSDNGSGIDEADFKAVFLPHATSKIKQASDLETIGTLGFRGEALASIASVAKVTLVSKTSESDVATKLSVEGGKYGEITKVAGNNGTSITVEDLFYCVPARAKFLKKNKTEEHEITNMISRIVLAHPEIHFTYIANGKKNIASIGETAKEAIYAIYGKEAVAETIEVKAEREGVSVSGFVGKPTFSKSNRTYQTLIVNGRYVVNMTVQTAVTNAYGDFLMKRQYPFFVLYLTVPTDEIDVNVHPNKLDVRFLKSQLIYSVVFEAVSRGLHNMDYVKEISTETNASLSFASSIRPSSGKVDKAGVNLNPFSANFDNMSDKEKDDMSEIVMDSVLQNNNEGKLRDNFGLGSKLLERIYAKMNAGEKDAVASPNYSLDENPSDNQNDNFNYLSEKTANIYTNNTQNGEKSADFGNFSEGFAKKDADSDIKYTGNKIKFSEQESFEKNSFEKIDYNELNDYKNNDLKNDLGKISDLNQTNFYKSNLNETKSFEQSGFVNTIFVKPKTEQSAFDDGEMKIVGKIFSTYLLIEWGSNIYMIDQHAAHERLRYEKLKAECDSGNLAVQPLLIPYVLSLNSEDDQIVSANIDAIRSVGFEIDEFGDKTYKISAVPIIVSEIDFNEFFNMFLAEKLNKNKVTQAELVKERLMQLACKNAVKGGDDLSENEVNKLLTEMSSQNISLFCPHGRPIVVRITKGEIEKWFKRIV